MALVPLSNYPVRPPRAQGNADKRGWGPGWPNCQHNMIQRVDITGTLFRSGIRKELVELVTLLVNECKRRGYVFGVGQDSDYGCWGAACRPITGSTTTPSNHSWGLAIDINAPANPYTTKRTDGLISTNIPPWMVELFSSFTFYWGGYYTGKVDTMHFEYQGTPALAVNDTARARSLFGSNPPPEPPVPPPPLPPVSKWQAYVTVAPGDRMLNKWSRGSDVEWVQKFIGVKVDGYYGDDTKSAVATWQKNHGLDPDGWIGKYTWAVMLAPPPPTNVLGAFPLPSGHFFGPSNYKPNYSHSGYYSNTDKQNLARYQQRMKDRGWKNMKVDGYYGVKGATTPSGNCYDITIAFQREKGLKADGLVGAATWTEAGRTDNVT